MPLVPPYIAALRPYEPGRSIEEVQREYGLAHVAKLASNENPLGPSPLALREMSRSAGTLNLYPNAGLDLRRVLAEKFDLKIENVKILEDADTTIVGVIPPTVEKEATPGTPGAEEQAEPEVIGKGKKPEEGAEGEATAAPADKKAEAAPPAKEEKKK